jgi:hypothetical protein
MPLTSGLPFFAPGAGVGVASRGCRPASRPAARGGQLSGVVSCATASPVSGLAARLRASDAAKNDRPDPVPALVRLSAPAPRHSAKLKAGRSHE